jgi:hypothetical protein
MTCKTHPDAPHGFDRGASHTLDRYVCECEFWEEPKMKERIRELAEQARQEFLELPTGYTPEQVGMYPQLMQKFAELIVRECIERGNVLAKHYINNHPEQEQAFLLAAIADYSSEIEKHFGVE